MGRLSCDGVLMGVNVNNYKVSLWSHEGTIVIKKGPNSVA